MATVIRNPLLVPSTSHHHNLSRNKSSVLLSLRFPQTSFRLSSLQFKSRFTVSCSQSEPSLGQRPPYIPNHIPDPSYVRIFDTTLRDGEQSPGASMTSKEKLDVARQLAKLGVDIIEAGFPAASKDDFEAVKMIAQEVGNAVDDDGYVPVICGLSRCNENDIRRAWEAVKYAKRPRIHTFIATSAIHMEYKLRMSKEKVIDTARKMVKFARSLGCEDVEFSPEDAGRSDREFLYEILGEVIKAGATTLNIPDTVGINLPSEFGRFIADIKANTPGIENVTISTHCQNDLGLSTASTIEGARAGARQLEVTINGTGERAGNASLEEVVMALRCGADVTGNLFTGINTKHIFLTSKMVEEYTGLQLQPQKALVGANAFTHESGIHQDFHSTNMGTANDTDTNVDGENSVRRRIRKKSMPESGAREHKEQLQKLSEKDPEFYEFLKEHDEELLQFSDDDLDEDVATDIEDEDLQLDEEASEDEIQEKEQKSSKEVITTSMVDLWCKSIQENGSLSALRSLMRAFRTACHYGDEGGNESMTKLSVMSSTVFNKIMLTVLTEMDGILRKLFKLPASGGKKENITDLMATKHWISYGHLVKSYLGNALHVLNQMTDTEMISFTLRRLRYSLLFLAAVPSLLRKYIKVVLHFWGTGGGALPVVSFLFMRDLCIRIGSGCVDECFKGIYKAYVLNCHFVNAVKLKHIRFLGNCVIELLGVDLPTAYQHAFIYIRQLAMILRDALNAKTKEAFRKVYEWKFINCLELWTGAICAYSSESDFKQLAYPLTQIISGVARLVPTARYFPLRLRCVRMLNQIAASTHSFVPVSMLLLDMLEMKELNRPPTGGVGKAVDLRSILKVSKLTLKTRAFQEACVISVVEELAEHLAQWSYSVAFMELSFIPLVRLRSFCKLTKVERFRKEMRQLIRQIEASASYVNGKRMSISFLPNDPAAASFLEDEKKSASSALSKYVLTLRQRAEQKNNSLMESSVLVGEESSKFGKEISESDEEDARKNEEGAAVFSSSWLPGKESKIKQPEETKRKRKKQQKEKAIDDDVVEDLVLSSDEDMPSSHSPSAGKNDDADNLPSKGKRKQKKIRTKRLKKN